MRCDSDMDLADLRAVLAVAESASYTRAAQKLGITQPAISRRITALEAAINARLFRRDGNTFVLTEAGAAFCERATQVLELMSQLSDETNQSARTPRGTIALGVPPTTGEVLVRHLVPRYRAAYPEVFVRIEQGYVNDLFDMLMDRRIDIAVLNGPFSAASVDLEPLYDYHLGLVCPIGWTRKSPLGGKPLPPALTLAQVAQLPLIVPSSNQSMRHLIDAEFRANGLKPNIVMEVNSFVLQRSVVRAGEGCMFMSDSVVRGHGAGGKLTFAPILDSKMIYTMYIATRRAGTPTLATKLMARMLPECMGPVREYLETGVD